MRKSSLIALTLTVGFGAGWVCRPSHARRDPTHPRTQPVVYVNRPDPAAPCGRSLTRLLVLRHGVKDKQISIFPGAKLNEHGVTELGADQWVISVDGNSYLAAPSDP